MRSLIALLCLTLLSLSACGPFSLEGEPGPFVEDDRGDSGDSGY